MKHTLLPILAGLLCLPVFAGDDDQRREEWMRTKDKEMHRAKESAQYHGDIESAEKKEEPRQPPAPEPRDQPKFRLE